MNDWLAAIKVNIILKTSPESPLPWLVVYAEDYIPPIRLSILIGECVHNMRSAIDNLVCGVALTLKPTCKCRGLAFPLFKDQAEWDKDADKPLKGMPADAKEAIRQLQPWADTVSPNPLTILNKLSNLDKHRACNFTLAYGRNVNFRIHCTNGAILDVKATSIQSPCKWISVWLRAARGWSHRQRLFSRFARKATGMTFRS
ncbi:MAG TPA: hypothetical protein VHY84_15985 [Bryobacteraceae bacterium]|jgi:hypothetical protein|nr:hypothetical protein [Bryobacteraceae bacterium]